jgi:hypothetical protein
MINLIELKFKLQLHDNEEFNISTEFSVKFFFQFILIPIMHILIFK